MTGSAILLLSCNDKKGPVVETSGNFVSEQGENTELLVAENGNLTSKGFAPLLERYGYADEPFVEYRRGIRFETYNDSTHKMESSIESNYAINMEDQQLWELKGNVVAVNAKGEQLETQQLFWNQKEKKVYSNVDTKVTQGSNVVYGDGFESDETFTDYEIRNAHGKVFVNVERGESDSTALAAPSEPLSSSLKPDEEPDALAPVIREGEAVAKPIDAEE